MEKIKICRTIQPDGSLQEGSGIVLNTGGPTETILKDLTSPLFSNPITGEIAGVLTFPEETNGKYMKGVLISPAGATGPPEHFHPNYVEEFTIIEGEFIFQYSSVRLSKTSINANN